MGKSYRKQPFMAICGNGSAKQDKIAAHRAMRRKQNEYLRNEQNYDQFLIPDIYECAHNDVWGWGRDGNQMYWSPSKHGRKTWFVKMMRK